MLDLESLRCFQAAALRLNFRAASRAVGLSPAAFSDRIQRLEDELGARLFIRSTRRVVLSPDGERLLPQAQKVLSEASRCWTLVGTGEPTPFELTIGTRWELGMSWVLPAIDGLEAQNPERRLNLAFGNGTPLLERLRRGQIDAVIGSMRITGNHMLEHRIIPKFPVLVVVLFVLCSTRGLAHEFMAHGAKGGSSSRLPLPMLKSWRYTPPNEIRLPIEGSLASFTVCLGYGR